MKIHSPLLRKIIAGVGALLNGILWLAEPVFMVEWKRYARNTLKKYKPFSSWKAERLLKGEHYEKHDATTVYNNITTAIHRKIHSVARSTSSSALSGYTRPNVLYDTKGRRGRIR